MDTALKQQNRLGHLKTPLGDDTLVLARFDGSEGLSELFEYRVEALSDNEVDYNALLGQGCTVTIEEDGKKRFFNGIVVEAQWIGKRHDLHAHRFVLRPWLWVLSRTADCRFFQEKKAQDIIKEVFDDKGFSDYEMKLSEDHPQREYCVQYRETDFAFVSRLMEHEGIYYYFTHTDGKHTMVLCDSMAKHDAVPDLTSVRFIDDGNANRRDEQHIYSLISERRFRTGKVMLNEYNELESSADQKGKKEQPGAYNKADMEVYDYPGKYKHRGEGDYYAKVVLEAEQSLDERRHASGNAVCLFPGGLTTLKEHPRDSENKQYLVVRATHLYTGQYYRSGGSTQEEEYSGEFEFLPNDGTKAFRAPIVTPKPLIHGIQTATVAGDSGQEIDVDKYGRIKVQFFWDRKKKQSCRIRVAQVWAGKTWGGQFIPRVGMEAVVEFLEGDPDRPLIVGAVYNDEYTHPYNMPGDKTVSGLKSNSSTGGNGYNEWKFEDKAGSEKITVHAEKDYDLTIRNSETRNIGEIFVPPKGSPSRETTLKSGDDKLSILVGDQQIAIPLGSQTITIGLNMTTTAMATITITCGGSVISMTPGSISLVSPTISLTAMGAINLTAPAVNIGAVLNTPSLMAGAALIGGVPI